MKPRIWKLYTAPPYTRSDPFLIITYGQYSEICGIYHRFIPIKIESINFKNFIKLSCEAPLMKFSTVG